MKKISLFAFVVTLLAYLSYELVVSNKVGSYPPPQITGQVEKDSLVTKVLKPKSNSDNNAVEFKPEAKNLLNTKVAETQVSSPTSAETQEKPKSANYGMTEGVEPNANPQVASVAAALKNNNHPERLSPLVQPKPFDREAFEKDPKTYLQVIEPGRVFQSLNPDKGVTSIQIVSEAFVTIQQKEQTVLKVKALPLMPVTFTSFDLGAFQNKLTSITVQADSLGLATATFIATEGTIADCNILASCPVTSGRIKFIVNIQKNNLFIQEK